MSVTRSALVSLLLLVACSESAGPAEHAAVISQAVIDGRLDAATKAVVMTGNPDMMCSGVIVSADVVLTAAHCVGGAPGPGRCQDIPYPATLVGPANAYVYAGDSADDPAARRLVVAQVIPLPDAKSLCGNDLVALRLARPATVEAIAPRLDSPPLVGGAVSVVGFGNVVPADADSSGARRRRDDATITHVGARAASASESELTAGDFAVSIGPCQGDSGGPALDGQGSIVGIMSRGKAPLCTEMAYTRLDAHAEWLRGVVRDAARLRDVDPPPWARDETVAAPDGGDAAPPPATAPPSGPPSSCSSGGSAGTSPLGLLAAALLFARRRRSASGRC